MAARVTARAEHVIHLYADPVIRRLVERPAWLPGNVTSVTLPDAGHVPMWDAPEALIALIATADRAT